MGIYGLYNDAAPNRDAACCVATKTSRADMTMRAITTGKGGLDRMRGGGRDGRGNLRENREDPAPTVGRLRGWRCDPNAGHCRLYAHFLRPTYPHEPVVLKRRGTPRRYALREMGLRD